MLNIEEGSEHSVLAGDDHNEWIYDMVNEVKGLPDTAMVTNFAYGARVGYWRIVDLLDSYGVTCTINGCARALEMTPWIAEDCVRRGYEIACHGYRWETHEWMTEEFERKRIADAVETIRRVCGVRPIGWHTRSPNSVNTRRLVIEEGGFMYDSDTTEDDLPFLIDLGTREHVVLPYTMDNNDMHLHRPEGLPHRAPPRRILQRGVRLAVSRGREDAAHDDHRVAHPHHRAAWAHFGARHDAAPHDGEAERLVHAPQGHRETLARSFREVQMNDTSSTNRPELFVGIAGKRYRVERPWGAFPPGMKTGAFCDVACDSKSNVYVFQRFDPLVDDLSPPCVLVFDTDGKYLNSWGGGGIIKDPHHLFIDAADRVFLVDRDAHQVRVFDTAGKLLFDIGERDRPGKPFNHPSSVAVAPSGDIYVADGYGGTVVHRFAATGAHIRTWGGPGNGPGQFTTPHGIWVLPDGRVLVGDRENDRIQVFDPAGAYLCEMARHAQADVDLLPTRAASCSRPTTSRAW